MRFYLDNRKWPPLTGRIEMRFHTQIHLTFSCEFRPLVRNSTTSSHLSHLGTVETTSFDGELVVAWLVFVGFLVPLLLELFWVGFLCLFPHQQVVSFPSLMIWAHRPHGVCTRGKKNWMSTVWLDAQSEELPPNQVIEEKA